MSEENKDKDKDKDKIKEVMRERAERLSKSSSDISFSSLPLSLHKENKDNKDKGKGKGKKKKACIPLAVKRVVWNTYIGEEVGKTKCLCCNVTDITQMTFHCGHVVSENKGGPTTVDNLRPICSTCNLSMGTENMQDFIRKYF